MSLQVYQEYKNSGFRWIGDVPSHWKVRPVGRCFVERRDKVNDSDFPPLSVTKNGVVPQLEHAAKTDANDNRRGVLAGDFVINSRSDRKGSSGMASEDGSVSLINTVLRPNEDLEIRFVHYLFRSINFQEEFYRFGKGIVADLWSTSYAAMKGICIAIPPLKEQKAICTYLDSETLKIDELLADQRRLIELLNEKRQAVISHAVTKGINPDAPMKPSGIEWLGDVPEHWTRTRPKYVTSKIVDGVHFRPNYVSQGVPFVTVKNLTASREISFDDLNYISRKDHDLFCERANPEKGDVLITKDGTLGVTRVVDTDRIFSIFVSVALLKPIKEVIDPWFLACALESTIVFQQFKARELGSALKHIHLAQLRNVYILVPTLSEQKEIVRVLRSKTDSLDALITNTESAIELLQERRTALISAAVTGKIDVRVFASEGVA